jgi:hypothetical protein
MNSKVNSAVPNTANTSSASRPGLESVGPQFQVGTAAQVIYDALMSYADSTLGAERSAARNLAMQADVLAEVAQCGDWLSRSAIKAMQASA